MCPLQQPYTVYTLSADKLTLLVTSLFISMITECFDANVPVCKMCPKKSPGFSVWLCLKKGYPISSIQSCCSPLNSHFGGESPIFSNPPKADSDQKLLVAHCSASCSCRLVYNTFPKKCRRVAAKKKLKTFEFVFLRWTIYWLVVQPPLWKILVNWDDEIPNIWRKKNGNQSTNQNLSSHIPIPWFPGKYTSGSMWCQGTCQGRPKLRH